LQPPLPTLPRAQPARCPLFCSLCPFVRALCHRCRGLDVGVCRALLCMHTRARAPTHVHAHARRGKIAPFCPFTAPSRARWRSTRCEPRRCRWGRLPAIGVLKPDRCRVCMHDRAQASREPRRPWQPQPLRRCSHLPAVVRRAPTHVCRPFLLYICLRACGHTHIHHKNASHLDR
jgi:hypothetical protein